MEQQVGTEDSLTFPAPLFLRPPDIQSDDWGTHTSLPRGGNQVQRGLCASHGIGQCCRRGIAPTAVMWRGLCRVFDFSLAWATFHVLKPKTC